MPEERQAESGQAGQAGGQTMSIQDIVSAIGPQIKLTAHEIAQRMGVPDHRVQPYLERAYRGRYILREKINSGGFVYSLPDGRQKV